MLDLESPYWAELTHAFGTAAKSHSVPTTWFAGEGESDFEVVVDIPSLLRQLESSPVSASDDWKADPWYSLWGTLCHQGDVYTASYAAVPHMVRIAIDLNVLPDWQFFGLPASIEIGRARGRGPEVPEALAEPYYAALRDLHVLAYRNRDREWNELLSRAIAAALVTSKGHALLGETIFELSPDAVRDVRIHQGLEGDDE
jgi:hypothetical protein